MRISSKDLKEFKENPPGISYDRMQVQFLEKKLQQFVKIITAREGEQAPLYVWKQLMKFQAKLYREIDTLEKKILKDFKPKQYPFLKDKETITITKDKEIILTNGVTERNWKKQYKEKKNESN